MPWFYRVLLIVNLAWCCAGLVSKKLPAWRMFEQVEELDYTLTDAAGRSIEVRDYLPGGSYVNRRGTLISVVEFICERERARAPFRLTETHSALQVEVGRVDCKIPD